jgi:hypothetical protein
LAGRVGCSDELDCWVGIYGEHAARAGGCRGAVAGLNRSWAGGSPGRSAGCVRVGASSVIPGGRESGGGARTGEVCFTDSSTWGVGEDRDGDLCRGRRVCLPVVG